MSSQRLASGARGWLIAGFLALYGFFFRQPEATLELSFLVGAILQLILIVLRRVVPADWRAESLQLYELVADASSVLLFALGIFGGIAARTAQF